MDASSNHDTGAAITTDIPCISCGYNLRTLAVSARCPECGQPVESTTRYALVFANPTWLKALRDGAAILAWTPVALFGVDLLAVGAWLLARYNHADMTTLLIVLLVALAHFAAFYAFAVGTGKLTRVEPTSRVRARRFAARAACMCPLALFVLGVLLSTGSPLVAILVSAVPLLWPMFLAVHAKSLGRRSFSPVVARTASVVVWAGGISTGLLLLCAIVAGAVLLLLPPYGGTGWATLWGSAGCAAPVALAVMVILHTLLMFRLWRELDWTIKIIEGP